MKQKLPLIKAVAMLCALVTVLISMTFAWFQNSTDSSIDPFTENVVDVSGNGTQIFGKKVGDWSEDSEADWFTQIGHGYQGAGKVAFSPVSGNGLAFFKEKYESASVAGGQYKAEVKSGYAAVDAASEKCWLELPFKLKNTNRVNLFLDTDSYVRPASDDLSSAAAAGAIRVAVYKMVGDEYKPLFVWIPNTTYALTTPVNPGEKYTFKADGAVEDAFVFRTGTEETDVTTVYPTRNGQADGEKLAAGMTVIDEVRYLWGDLTQISGLSETSLAVCEAEAEEEYRLVIWLEGSDRECRDFVLSETFQSLISFNTKIIEG